jgi:hypothetical protein
MVLLYVRFTSQCPMLSRRGVNITASSSDRVKNIMTMIRDESNEPSIEETSALATMLRRHDGA